VKNAPAEAAHVHLGVSRRPSVFADYLTLTKPRLNLLVVLTSAAGYYLGANEPADWVAMAQAVAGTTLVAGGAAALNQWYERDTDALMPRTRLRPLPDGRVSPDDARTFGAVLSAMGVLLLAVTANLAAAALALATLVVYVVIYTPMKRRSPASTLVGAIPGALPALIGWAAASGSVSIGGWTLFAIVFLWQIPHFMAIAWMFRADYGRAGFPMLPVIEPDGRRTGRQAVIYSIALLPVSLTPSFVGVSGQFYLYTAAVLGLALIALAVRFAQSRSDAAARALFFGSITYLPLIWAAMILNH
jgi:protoheme IX farnesyltransferase